MGIPVLVAILWLASGRETLTKHERVVSVTVKDELFGDTNTVSQLRPGPIFGYYVGLDLVIIAVLGSLITLAIAGVVLLLIRHRAGRERNSREHPYPA